MGIAKGVAWALGLYESDEHYQKRLNKWNKQQNENLRLVVSNVLLKLENRGYQSAVNFLEYDNSGKKIAPWPNIDLAIKKMWETKPEIREKETNWNFDEYYQKFEQKNNKTDIDKEKEILQLKIRLAELERNK